MSKTIKKRKELLFKAYKLTKKIKEINEDKLEEILKTQYFLSRFIKEENIKKEIRSDKMYEELIDEEIV